MGVRNCSPEDRHLRALPMADSGVSRHTAARSTCQTEPRLLLLKRRGENDGKRKRRRRKTGANTPAEDRKRQQLDSVGECTG